MRNRTLPHSPGSVRARDAQSHERNSLCENSGLAPLAHARGSACLSFDSAPNGTATVGERSKSVFTQTGKQVVRHPVFAPNVTRAALAWLVIFAGVGFAADRSIALDIRNLDLRGVKAEVVSYRGRTALKLVEASQSDEPALAVLKNVALRDGTIQIEVSGVPSASAAPDARGFVELGSVWRPGRNSSSTSICFASACSARRGSRSRVAGHHGGRGQLSDARDGERRTRSNRRLRNSTAFPQSFSVTEIPFLRAVGTKNSPSNTN